MGYRGATATAAHGRWVTRHRPARERQATKQPLEGFTQVKLSTRNSMQTMCDHHTGVITYTTHIVTSKSLCLPLKCVLTVMDILQLHMLQL